MIPEYLKNKKIRAGLAITGIGALMTGIAIFTPGPERPENYGIVQKLEEEIKETDNYKLKSDLQMERNTPKYQEYIDQLRNVRDVRRVTGIGGISLIVGGLGLIYNKEE